MLDILCYTQWFESIGGTGLFDIDVCLLFLITNNKLSKKGNSLFISSSAVNLISIEFWDKICDVCFKILKMWKYYLRISTKSVSCFKFISNILNIEQYWNLILISVIFQV